MTQTNTLRLIRLAALVLLILWGEKLSAQQIQAGRISGSFQSDAQWYLADSVIDAETVRENVRSNSFLQLSYTQGSFSAGMRYEAYIDPLLGFRKEYKGQGIPYRWAAYNSEKLDLTVGNFYDQFGSGMIFRAYQEWTLGIDNSIDGIKATFRPIKGVQLKGLVGKQRVFWGLAPSQVRGADLEIGLHDLISGLSKNKWRITLGGSVLNRFLEDDDISYQLPENVSAFSSRLSLNKGGFLFKGEYVYKINDPINKNDFVYDAGKGLLLNFAYSQKGLGFSMSMKHIENMDFRSFRSTLIEEGTLNFLPPTTLQHTYRLPTLYPYATQPNGEFGAQAEFTYKFKKKSALGGKYGTGINIAYSRAYGLKQADDYVDTSGRVFTHITKFGPDTSKHWYTDLTVAVSKKWSKKVSNNLTYINMRYDKEVIEEGVENSGIKPIKMQAVILETTLKFKGGKNAKTGRTNRYAVRSELQWMTTTDQTRDLGDWAMVLVEFSKSPHYYLTIWDEWNYGNPIEANRVHFFNVNGAYVFGANRISLTYGRQRSGLLCVGGICRFVPASSGFSLSLTSSF